MQIGYSPGLAEGLAISVAWSQGLGTTASENVQEKPGVRGTEWGDTRELFPKDKGLSWVVKKRARKS